MGANSNFYRPGYGYMMPSANVVAPIQPGGTYQFNDQINLPPFPSVQPSQALQPTSSYGSNNPQQQQIQLNDGWSVPLGPYSQTSGGLIRPSGGLQQQPINSYDSYSVSPGNQQLVQPGKQYTNANPMDPYGGSTKGGGSNKQQLSTTKK